MKRNKKLDSITDLPISKLGNNEDLIDTLSTSMNPLFSKMGYNEVSTETHSTSQEIFTNPNLYLSPASTHS